MAPERLVFADLHVHLGRAAGRPVKIAASPALTVDALLAAARARKGLDLIGLVDGATAGGLFDLAAAVRDGRLSELPGGGLGAPDGLVLLPGLEVEISVAGSRVHFIVLVPGLAAARRLSDALAPHQTNPWLSSQMARGLDAAGLLDLADRAGGLVWPAHAFTPHRGLFGCAIGRPEALGGPGGAAAGSTFARLAAVELGLSADTEMADRLSWLSGHTFLSNSDAHSLGTLARECNLLRLGGPPDFSELRLCLARRGGRGVAANYGLVPALGKYHRTVCLVCGAQAAGEAAATCPRCGSARVVRGVRDRLEEIADLPAPVHPAHRPPYRSQVPLAFLPGVGPRTAARLVAEVGPELDVLHTADPRDVARVAGRRVAAALAAARRGELTLRAGGGGRYGAVVRAPGEA